MNPKNYTRLQGHGIKTFITGKDSMPNNVKNMLETYGTQNITNINVCRVPIRRGLLNALNFLSAGKIYKNEKELGYDNLFHLFMVLTLENGTKLSLEKNEIVNLKPYTTPRENSECRPMSVGMKTITLNELIDNVEKRMGTRTYHYDVISNNCQVFLTNILQASGLSNSDIESFINQDVKEVLKGIPRTMISIAGIAMKLLERMRFLTGEGFNQPIYKKPFINIPVRPPPFNFIEHERNLKW
jgi:hypothetical protein